MYGLCQSWVQKTNWHHRLNSTLCFWRSKPGINHSYLIKATSSSAAADLLISDGWQLPSSNFRTSLGNPAFIQMAGSVLIIGETTDRYGCASYCSARGNVKHTLTGEVKPYQNLSNLKNSPVFCFAWLTLKALDSPAGQRWRRRCCLWCTGWKCDQWDWRCGGEHCRGRWRPGWSWYGRWWWATVPLSSASSALCLHLKDSHQKKN